MEENMLGDLGIKIPCSDGRINPTTATFRLWLALVLLKLFAVLLC